MKKKLLIRLFLLLTMFPAFTTGALAQTDDIDYTTGVFFVNEDWYGHQNSTVNYLTEKGEWVYRVIQKENPGMELGCTNQHGIIYGDRFYLIAKQERDPGSKIKGGRITVADAKTMKVIKQLDKIDPSGNTCDGRGCLGVDENKVYISTSNGIWIFNSNTLEVTGQIKGTENPFAASGTGGNANPGNKALYWGQSGCMARINDYVFSVHQEYGVLVIDPSTDKVIKVIDMKSLIDTFNEYLAEHDADNMDAAMVKTVEKVSDNSKFNAEIKNGELIVTPKTKFTSEEFVKIKINSNGKIAYATIKLNCTTNGIENVQNNDVKEIKRYNLSGQETNKRNGRIQIIRMSDGTVKKVFVK